MKKKYKVAAEVRQELLNRIRNEGLSVAQAAKDAGVSETTVYGWLGKGADSVPSVLEFAKLKRENQELLELVGELTLKLSTAQTKKASAIIRQFVARSRNPSGCPEHR